MRALSLSLITGFWLFLSGCQGFPQFGNQIADDSPSGDWGRDVDPAWQARADRDRRDGAGRNRPKLDAAQLANLNSFLQTGTAALQRNSLADARIQFETALQLDPQNAHAHHMLARIADMEARFEDAETHYLNALGAGRNPDLLSDMGYSFMQQGRLDEARIRLRDALTMNPQHQKAKVNLAAVHAWAGDTAGALAWLRQAGSEDDAQRSLQSILANRPPGLGGEPRYVDGQKPPETFEEMLQQAEQEKLKAQRERMQERQAQLEWERARMSEILGDSNGAGAVQPSDYRSQNQQPPITYLTPPGAQGATSNGQPPAQPIDVRSRGAAGQGQSAMMYQDPRFNPSNGGGTTQQPPQNATPPQWQHAPSMTHQQTGQIQQPSPDYYDYYQQQRGAQPVTVPPQFGPQPQMGMNPQAAPWPNGRIQSTTPVVPGGQLQPTHSSAGGMIQQNPSTQPIQQLGHWDNARQSVPPSNAAARAARIGMSAGPGSPFPVQQQQQQQPAAAVDAPQPGGAPAASNGTHDVWRPGQAGAPPVNPNQTATLSGTVQTSPPHQPHPSQISQMPSPTWNHQLQQSNGRPGQWSQPAPLGQHWQANGQLASPTWQMQSPSMNPQFAPAQYYNPPNRADIQHRETMNLGR